MLREIFTGSGCSTCAPVGGVVSVKNGVWETLGSPQDLDLI